MVQGVDVRLEWVEGWISRGKVILEGSVIETGDDMCRG